MPFDIPLDEAQREFPQFTFISPLTPSAQKAAFHVRDEAGNDLCLKIIFGAQRMYFSACDT